MTTPNDCSQNTDPLKLVREGTSQDQRFPDALNPDKSDNPDYPRVDERKTEHAMVFAKAYSKYLQFYGSENTVAGNWEAFFSQDVSVQLAFAAVQDVDNYKANIKASFDFLKNHENKNKENELKNHLGYLFSTIGTLAKQLDVLKEGLPSEISLKGTLQNLIRSQLAPGIKQLMLYYRDGLPSNSPSTHNAPYLNNVKPMFSVMGTAAAFKNVTEQGLSRDWILATDSATNWAAYVEHLKQPGNYPATKIYGNGDTLFKRLNHIATHNLFTDIFDRFLKVFARTVTGAQAELEKTFSGWDNHEPHYALFLSFLRLFDYARAETNTLTQRHLDFYYKEVLKLKEKPAEPSHAHLLIELAKHVDSHEIKEHELFKAGKDALGIDAFFANDRDFVANRAKVNDLKTLYRHKNTPIDTLTFDNDRLFASTKTDSADGLGAKLTTADKSWHPFFNKTYENGKLTKINMPQAEVGFAIASHYLWMAEGERTITINFTLVGIATNLTRNRNNEIICLVTTEKGWFEKTAVKFITESEDLKFELVLSGGDPAVTPYSQKAHGYNFSTNLPILLVKLRHQDSQDYLYRLVQEMVIEKIDLTVDVKELKSLAVSNDFGPVDTSKPFQPFGAQPVAGNSMLFGSKEIFQKNCQTATLNVAWQNLPDEIIIGYEKLATPTITIDSLQDSAWKPQADKPPFSDSSFSFNNSFEPIFPEQPDFSTNEFFYTGARTGFTRLSLNDDFGQVAYLNALRAYLIAQSKTPPAGTNPGNPPYIPTITSVSADYTTAAQSIALNASVSTEISFDKRPAKFYHLYPFGYAEQHPWLKNKAQAFDPKIYLVPQFYYESILQEKAYDAEFYIGITGLKPPQNLALLFQIADGTADPLSAKPNIHWSYLRNNEWVDFTKHEVQDSTDGLLNSGIITFSIPDEASSNNTVLPAGQHWLRAAVADKSNGVCRLLTVSAQGLTVTFQNQSNDPAFAEKVLAEGSISKLNSPDAVVKAISQPFPSFGGRGTEQESGFYTRVSERLRHKDRGIALWDYERLILEAFPQIYKAKCLNHTHYETDAAGILRTYNELAPGHVTIVTIPNQPFHNLRDPLKPFTSLGLLAKIKAFLTKRLSCFVTLHVKNPRFEEVRVNFKVKFYEGFDEIFYEKKLNQAITAFLSPWAFAGDKRPSFGGKIYKSVLMNFIEEQPYVDYVTDFQLFHDLEDKLGTINKEEVEGSTAISILVSSKKHIINEKIPGEA